MADAYKGLTIQFRGDTTDLSRKLSSLRRDSSEVGRGSRAYDRLQREVATTSKRLSDAETATRDAFEAFKRAADGADDLSSTEVRRLYDAASGNHMFTASPDEAAALLDAGWADEVVGFLVG